MKKRYIAEWVCAQFHDEHGEWDPARDDYRFSCHRTLDEATKACLEESKKANVVEWGQVTEEQQKIEGDIWSETRVWSLVSWDSEVFMESQS